MKLSTKITDQRESIPFTTFGGWTKQLEAPEYGIDARVMETAFPGFFGEPVVNYADRERLENHLARTGGKLEEWETAYRYRRYAGGADLPRGRYYTVCEDESGEDHHTLARELQAYIDVARSGEVYVYDMACADQFAARAWYSQFRKTSIASDEMIVSFRSKPKVPSPLIDIILDGSRRGSAPPDLPMFLRTTTSRKSISRVLDLRLPIAQDWMFRQLTFGIAHTLFRYSSVYRPDLIIRRTAELLADRGPVDRVSSIIEEPRQCKRRIIYSEKGIEGSTRVEFGLPNNFLGLLSFLVFPFCGGSPITEVIGIWLRRLGVQALVFPSARNNISVHIEGEHIRACAGWNLVDFRDSPPIDDCIRHVYDPDSWRFVPPDVTLRTFPVGSPQYGSFTFEGLAAYQDLYWATKFGQYYKARGVV